MRRILDRPGRLQPSSAAFTLGLALALVLFYNGPLWAEVLRLRPDSALFLTSFFVFLVALLNLLLSLVAFRYLLKPIAVLLLLTTSLASYFMSAYGVVIDRGMLQNVMETDLAEARDLLTVSLLSHVVLLGVVPALLVARLPIRYRRWPGELKLRVLSLLLSTGAIVIVALGYYPDYASLLRNNTQLRYLFTPTNYLYATVKYVRGLRDGRGVVLPVGLDAERGPLWAGRHKRALLVIVLGETARAQNFALNGYPRPTNPALSRASVVNFRNVYACGTATAVSVPCMFSDLGHDNYDQAEAARREGLLDVLEHAGMSVLWRDNNSGCKGACERIETEPLAHFRTPDHCDSDHCFDEVLLNRLDEYLARVDNDAVIVLHQNGSHGPAYYRRYPKRFERFTPVCPSRELQECSREQIRNTYDNTILYTDYLLGRVIEFLKARSERYDAAMIYVSDHGESLGEHGLYLHGLPYFMAPEEQTHVPFLLWLSEGFQAGFALDAACLARHADDRLSHDNLFHSVLGALDVKTAAYDPRLDIFAACRRPTVHAGRGGPARSLNERS